MAAGQGLIEKEGGRDMVMLSPLHPIPRHASSGARKVYPSLTLMLYNARSIDNKTPTLQDYFAEYNMDLVCVTETWV